MLIKVTGFLLISLLFFCSPPPPPQTPTLSPSSTPSAMITRVQGQVNVQQVITGQTMLASTGNLLWQGDVIITSQDAEVEVLCSDGTPLEVDANDNVTVTCGGEPDPVIQDIILRIHQGQVVALPGLRGDKKLVILNPIQGHLLEDRPIIRWTTVEGAEAYKITISNFDDGALWQVIIQDPMLAYPTAELVLTPEVDYFITVIAQTRQEETTVKVSVLSATDVDEVSQFEDKITALALSEESTSYILATYYAEQDLNSELALVAEKSSSPSVHQLLGNIYLTDEMYDPAGQSYQEAHRLAQKQGNQVILAEAGVGLGHVAYADDDFETALNHYRTAETLFQELGLESKAETVTEFIADTEELAATPTP